MASFFQLENLEEVDRSTPLPSDGEPKRKKNRKSLSESDMKDKKKKRKKKKSETDKKKKKKVKKDNKHEQEEPAEPRVEAKEENGVPDGPTLAEDLANNDESVGDDLIQIHADKSEILDVDFKIDAPEIEETSQGLVREDKI
jgi:hypothetical protein